MANSPSVGRIIEELEKTKVPRIKPPVPPGKPSLLSNGIISSASVDRDIGKIKKPAATSDIHSENGAENNNDLHSSCHAQRRCSSDETVQKSQEPFRYVPAVALSKVSRKLCTPPPTPPRPNVKLSQPPESKPSAKKSWIMIDGSWIQAASDNQERYSPNECQNGDDSIDMKETSSSADNNDQEKPSTHRDSCHSDISSSNDTENHSSMPADDPDTDFKKPTPPRHEIRRSSEPGHFPRGSPLRPLPPLPPAKPNLRRAAVDSVISNNSILSMSSAASDDGDGDSDVDTGIASSNCTTCGDQDVMSVQTDISSSTVSSPLSRAQKAFKCAEEFLMTEKSYVKTLEDLSVNFPRYMKENSIAVNRPLGDPDIPATVANSLHELRELHRILAQDFQERLDNWDSDPRLADILLRNGPYLKMSIRFLQRKEDLATQVLDACKKFPDFRTALTAFEKEHFQGLHLVHKLDSVHQRLCRYPLLLSSYLKYLPPDSAEFEIARKAKDDINGITLDLERSLAEGDSTRKLSELYRRIMQSRFEVIEPGRKLLKEGPILKYSRKEQQSRHLILFTDVLICCAPVVSGINNMLRVRHVFWLNEATTSVIVEGDTKADPDRSEWEFVVKGRQKSIIFVAETAIEGKAWVKRIQDAIGCAQRKQSEGRQSYIEHIPELPSTSTPSNQEPSIIRDILTTADLGRRAPVWTPDQRVTMCQCCSAAFTAILRRRHHCRACGRVICEDCSGKAPLEYLDFKADRVCPNCYVVLYDKTKDETYIELVLDKTRLIRYQLLCLFAAPKNGIRVDRSFSVIPGHDTNDEEEDDAALFKGYLRLSRNRQQWKRYWTVMRSSGLMEFYKAVNDGMYEMKIVLLGWQAGATDRDEFIFELTHTNQFTGNADPNLHYWLKADDSDAMDKWLSALDDFFAKFAS